MDKLVEGLVGTGDWSIEKAELAVEFEFKCAYCDKDLVSSVDNHRELQTDHIIPSSKGGEDHPDNYALSCRTCNTIKNVWNPLDHYTGKGKPSKQDLIEVARTHVMNVRADEQNDLDRYIEIIRLHGK